MIRSQVDVSRAANKPVQIAFSGEGGMSIMLTIPARISAVNGSVFMQYTRPGETELRTTTIEKEGNRALWNPQNDDLMHHGTITACIVVKRGNEVVAKTPVFYMEVARSLDEGQTLADLMKHKEEIENSIK